jgi:hypothetical protein
MTESNRLTAIILEVSDLERSAVLYRDAFGLDLHAGSYNQMGDDRWTSGAHTAYSWHDGAYLHFALYQAKTRQSTPSRNSASWLVTSPQRTRRQLRPAPRSSIRRGRSLGACRPATVTTTVTSSG